MRSICQRLAEGVLALAHAEARALNQERRLEHLDLRAAGGRTELEPTAAEERWMVKSTLPCFMARKASGQFVEGHDLGVGELARGDRRIERPLAAEMRLSARSSTFLMSDPFSVKKKKPSST